LFFDGIHIIDIGLGRFILSALPSFRYALHLRFFPEGIGGAAEDVGPAWRKALA
jgi:hypothetical protein